MELERTRADFESSQAEIAEINSSKLSELSGVHHRESGAERFLPTRLGNFLQKKKHEEQSFGFFPGFFLEAKCEGQEEIQLMLAETLAALAKKEREVENLVSSLEGMKAMMRRENAENEAAMAAVKSKARHPFAFFPVFPSCRDLNQTCSCSKSSSNATPCARR